jgi:hypothetical protein
LGVRVGLAIGMALSLVACGLLRPAPLAQNCAGWSQLGEEAQLVTAEALIQPWLMDRVRERQQLAPQTPDAQVYGAVVSSITKVCELERRPDLLLTQLVRDLYEPILIDPEGRGRDS